MKHSNYNFIIPDENKIYCFNGITKYFFNISDKNQALLTEILNHPDEYKIKLPNFYNKLLKGGFILNDDIDELNIIREKYKESCNSKHFSLVILPTLDCNFGCWYCYENHNNIKMSNKTIKNINKYLENIVNNEEIESLNIEWFGGEPFLHFYDIIKPICIYAKNLCKERNIPYSTTATSNGFLIKKDIAEELKELNFTCIQITLDGEKEFHDQTRVAPAGSSFEKILKNMNYLSTINEEVNIVIRINYDDQNFYPSLLFSQVEDLININNQHRFSFLLRRVWQVGFVSNGRNKALEFINLVKQSRFNYLYTVDFNVNFLPCYASMKNMKLITPQGSISKCSTKNDFEKHSLGQLTNEGNIKWNYNLPFDDIYATPLFDNKKCLKCKKLPLCMGECPKSIDKKGNLNLTNTCKGEFNDMTYIDAILNFCKSDTNKSISR